MICWYYGGPALIGCYFLLCLLWQRFGKCSGMTLSGDQMVHLTSPNFSNFIFSLDGISRLERTSCNMTELLSNFLEILPGIVEIFGAVLIWGLTCITVALAPDCTTRGTIPTWSLVERKENLSGKNNDSKWS